MKEVIERCNWLINKCEDKAITPDVKDDVRYLLEEIERLHSIIKDKKQRQDIAIRLLHKMFGTDDYEINYIIGIINGQRQIKFDDEILDKGE